MGSEMKTVNTDICVIGGGASGLSVAAGAAQLGVPVILIEGNLMGGECLNTGCVPSKALLHVAKQLNDAAGGSAPKAKAESANYQAAMAYVHEKIAEIAPHDSVERFTGMGVKVISEYAHFTSPKTLQAGDVEIKAKRFVIATGSSPAIPAIPGLSDVPYLTNETIFNNTRKPTHLIILGGGAMGLEMAQAHIRLGSKVTVIEAGLILGREDRDLVQPIVDQLSREGVVFYENAKLQSVKLSGRKIVATLNDEAISGSHLLVAAGRKANIDGLGLDEAGVGYSDRAIETNASLRTKNKKIYALGDVTRDGNSTHAAGYHAGIIIRNLLFHMSAKASTALIPRAVYTDLEFAQIGLTEAEARAQSGKIVVSRWPFAQNDRAITDEDKLGSIKVTTTKGGKILGVGITGTGAADLLTPWALAMSKNLKLSAIAGIIVPYPTRSEVSKRTASDFYSRRLFSPLMRNVVKFLSYFRY